MSPDAATEDPRPAPATGADRANCKRSVSHVGALVRLNVVNRDQGLWQSAQQLDDDLSNRSIKSGCVFYLARSHWRPPSVGTRILDSVWHHVAGPFERRLPPSKPELQFTSVEFSFGFGNPGAYANSSPGLEGDGRSVVFSTVKLPNGEPARVDWTVGHAGDSYKISDVKVEGLSLAETHRQEFVSVISKNGGRVATLIDVLKKKVGH